MDDPVIEMLLLPLNRNYSLVLQAGMIRDYNTYPGREYIYGVRSGGIDCVLGTNWYRDSNWGRSRFVVEEREERPWFLQGDDPRLLSALYQSPRRTEHDIQWELKMEVPFPFAPSNFGEAMLAIVPRSPSKTGLQHVTSAIERSVGLTAKTIHDRLLALFLQRYVPLQRQE